LKKFLSELMCASFFIASALSFLARSINELKNLITLFINEKKLYKNEVETNRNFFGIGSGIIPIIFRNLFLFGMMVGKPLFIRMTQALRTLNKYQHGYNGREEYKPVGNGAAGKH